PSFNLIVDKTFKVAKDYPLECITSIVGTAAAIQMTYYSADKQYEQMLLKIIMVAALALPSFLAITIRSTFRKLSPQRKYMEYGIIGIGLTLFLLSTSETLSTKDEIRFCMLSVLAHLMVSCAGFVGRGSTHAFWQFNKDLFLSIVTAGIFS